MLDSQGVMVTLKYVGAGLTESRKKMAIGTLEMLNSMITKYCEFYQRALDAGFSGQEAHKVAKNLFDQGYKESREAK